MPGGQHAEGTDQSDDLRLDNESGEQEDVPASDSNPVTDLDGGQRDPIDGTRPDEQSDAADAESDANSGGRPRSKGSGNKSTSSGPRDTSDGGTTPARSNIQITNELDVSTLAESFEYYGLPAGLCALLDSFDLDYSCNS